MLSASPVVCLSKGKSWSEKRELSVTCWRLSLIIHVESLAVQFPHAVAGPVAGACTQPGGTVRSGVLLSHFGRFAELTAVNVPAARFEPTILMNSRAGVQVVSESDRSIGVPESFSS